MLIANVDSGVDQNHVDLTHRFVSCIGYALQGPCFFFMLVYFVSVWEPSENWRSPPSTFRIIVNYAAVHGRLPDDRPAMLSSIEDALMRLKEDDAFRNELEGMPYLGRL